MGLNQFAGEIGEQIAKQVTRMRPGMSSGARKAGSYAQAAGMRTAAAAQRVPYGKNILGYGAMGGAAGGTVYGANKLRRKSKPSY